MFLTLYQGQNPEAAMLVASLREVIKTQAQELETLQKQVKDLSSGNSDVSITFSFPISFTDLSVYFSGPSYNPR